MNPYSNAEKFPPLPKIPKRDYDPCPLSGKPIDYIFTAINHRETDKPANFESIIEYLRNAENLGPNQELLYIGSGNFGVYEPTEENGRKKLQLVRKINYEDNHHKPVWRKELSPGISKDYLPAPAPLSELYSQEELHAFPKIGAGSGSYMPRNS